MSVHSTIVERKISNNDTELTVHLACGLMTIEHDATGFDAELIDRLIIDLQIFKSEYDTEINAICSPEPPEPLPSNSKKNLTQRDGVQHEAC